MIHALAAVTASDESVNPIIPAWSDLIWAGICFIVLLVFFWKLVIPNFLKTLDERSAAIEGNIAKADEAQNKAEELLEQYTAQLADARSEAAQIKEAAREDGKRIVAASREQATVEAQRIQQVAEAQIEAERQSAEAQLRTQLGTLTIELSSRVIGESLKDDLKAQGVVDRFIAEIESQGATGVRVVGKAGA